MQCTPGWRWPGACRVDAARQAAALLPAVLGAVALVLGGQRGLAVLVVGCGGFWLYEHRGLARSCRRPTSTCGAS